MESWRRVWREGFVSSLPTAGLFALRAALEADDPRLLQGETTSPPSVLCLQDEVVQAACLVTFCGWQGNELATVGDVDEFFTVACLEAGDRVGTEGACRYFLNWYDDTPRDQMRRELLSEVDLALAARSVELAAEKRSIWASVALSA